jgi:hypothetical protein
MNKTPPTTTKITLNKQKPAGIPTRDLPANVQAIVIGPEGNGVIGELVIRRYMNRDCRLVGDPGVTISGVTVQPITEPVSVTFSPTGDCSTDAVIVEPEPIPMSEMKKEDKGVIADVESGSEAFGKIGDGVIRGGDSLYAVNLTTGVYLKCDRYTVRLLQPGESLTIKREDDPGSHTWESSTKINQPQVADDKFERLADGTRKSCCCCVFDPNHTGCIHGLGSCLTTDARGYDGSAHPCWKPIEPKTLHHALWYGTVAEMVAAFVAIDGGWGTRWNRLCEEVTAVCPELDELLHLLDCRDDTSKEMDAEDFATIFVALRDRLGLFGEVKNDSN